jgi:hypothetical protein
MAHLKNKRQRAPASAKPTVASQAPGTFWRDRPVLVTGATVLVGGPAVDTKPAWSPDGQWIAFFAL